MGKFKPRLTTDEASKLLGCPLAEARMLLKAAGVEDSRRGRHGAHLWDYDGVRRLLRALGKKE